MVFDLDYLARHSRKIEGNSDIVGEQGIVHLW